MAIAYSSSSSSISASLSYTRSRPSRFLPSYSSFTYRSTSNQSLPRLTISSLHSSLKPIKPKSKSSTTEGSDYEFLHETPIPRWHKGSFVYVTLPIDILDSSGKIKMLIVMHNCLRALALAGVEGIVMEVWWGLVESDAPASYDWRGYLQIVALARHYGLKVRAVMAFHEFGSAGDSYWIPLPYWVRRAMMEDPDLAYTDKFGGRSSEYLSLGCDVVPVLRDRTPIQAYSDFMRSFRDTFKEYLGVTITGVQVGMGPGGELRYPSCQSQKLAPTRRFHELGEFQCYDKYMAASLEACGIDMGKPEWGKGGPTGTAGNLLHDHEETEFFKRDGVWNTEYGRFFLEWYSGMLLLHGERLCAAAENIFAKASGVSISGKLGCMHWYYDTESHASELTAGYYNTSIRDGYLPIAQMFGRYGVILCCRCFELRDREVKLYEPLSSPEGLVRQIVLAVKEAGVPLDAESSGKSMSGHDSEVQHVGKMLKLYSEGVDQVFFSFNIVRMEKDLFLPHRLAQLIEFVKQISPGSGRIVKYLPPPPRPPPRAKLSSVGVAVEVSSSSSSLLSGSSPSTAAVNKGMNMMKIKARKLNTAVDIVLDYDYGGANQRHDPRRGRAGGKVP